MPSQFVPFALSITENCRTGRLDFKGKSRSVTKEFISSYPGEAGTKKVKNKPITKYSTK